MAPGRAEADFHDVATLWLVRAASDQEVVEAACDALAEGANSPALRELAGVLYVAPRDEVEQLLPVAVDELGLPFWWRWTEEANVAAASVMARRFLAGLLSPRELAAWAHQHIGHDGGPATERLVGLDDEYDVSRYTGRSAAEIDDEVREAVRRLIEGE